MYLSLAFIGCKKSNTCTNAEITKLFRGTACEKWAISVGHNVYPTSNLPATFEQDNLKVCVVYNLYGDPKMCPCCGGTIAEIISIKKR